MLLKILNNIKDAGRRFVARRFDITLGEVSILHAGCGVVVYRTKTDALLRLIERLHPVVDDNHPLIRFGPVGDGGYLLPDDLSGIEACFSPGVSSVSGFEKQCADYGMNVFMADGSVSGPAEDHERFHFVKKYVGALKNENFMTIDDWVHEAVQSSSSDLLLQMDIEGAEYEALLRMSDSLLQRFRVLVIEFHQLNQLFDACYFKLASSAFEKLLLHHRCVHIHPNNCSNVFSRDGLDIPEIMEFTFLRKDRFDSHRPSGEFPHSLDVECTSRPSMVLPACWFSPS